MPPPGPSHRGLKRLSHREKSTAATFRGSECPRRSSESMMSHYRKVQMVTDMCLARACSSSCIVIDDVLSRALRENLTNPDVFLRESTCFLHAEMPTPYSPGPTSFWTRRSGGLAPCPNPIPLLLDFVERTCLPTDDGMAYAPGPGENRALSLIKWPFGKEYFGGLSSFGLICLGVYQPGPGSLAVPASSLALDSPTRGAKRELRR